ncbi:MAG: Holliday junction resolvase RuvX [Candidatus Rickettsia vulgarisii]
MIIDTLEKFSELLQPNKPIIAIDYGARKIGVAISNPEHTIAMPIKTINTPEEKEKIKEILNLIEAYSACAIVVGLPISMNGETSNQTTILLKFTEHLSLATNLSIYLQDERLTSKAADSLLKSFGLNRKQRNNQDDSIAASMILETTLNSIQKL